MNNISSLPTWTTHIPRVLGGIGMAVVAGYVAGVLLFVGVIAYSGCFISCSEPNRMGGLAFLGGAVIAGAAAVTALWWAVAERRVSLGRVYAGAAGVLTVLIAILATQG